MALRIPVGHWSLEAVFREPKGRTARAAALFCHPHPQYGGDMNNRVIFRAAKAALKADLAALRFNFRGVGASTGSYDQGNGEKVDVETAIAWLGRRCPGKALALVGFSFGAWVGLQVGCVHPAVKVMVGLGLPLSHYDFTFLHRNPKPVLLIVGARDEFCPGVGLGELVRSRPPTTRLHVIEETDHFFTGRLERAEALVAGFFREWKPGGGTA
jgi:alpha/beta superfamily hydrolase